MVKRSLLVTLFLPIIMLSFGQDNLRSRFDSFTNNQRNKYEEQSRDLRDKWERYSLSEGLGRTRMPIVDTVPLIVGFEQTGKPLRVSDIIGLEEPFFPTTTDAGFSYKIPTDSIDTRIVSFNFFGDDQSVRVPSSLGYYHPSGISEKDVDDFWRELDRLDFSSLLFEIGKRKYQLGFNDWAVLEWIEQLSKAIFPMDRYSESTILSVYLLNQLGLMTRIARVRGKLTILFSSVQTVYGRKYVVLDTYRFYLADPSIVATEIYTYGNEVGWKTRPLNLRIKEPLISRESSYKMVYKKSEVFGETISLPVNMTAMALYSHYPQLEAREYVLSCSDSRFREALSRLLPPRLSGKTDSEMINSLLRFLQQDFEYRIDLEQFGYEKPFFPEENFIYAYNDCEDRSILLAVLMRDLLRKKTVLLDYDDHLAVAICVEGNLKGDYVKVGNEKYYVCDPSYMNATIGMSMPHYRNRPAKVWIL